MTPEEKFNQDIWWILQEIQKDVFLATRDGRVEFIIRTPSKTSSIKQKEADCSIPDEETQRRLLLKLKDWETLEMEVIDNILRGSDIFNPKIYELTLKQPKFNELYDKYETIFTEKGTKSNLEKEPFPSPKFRFNQGVLFRDFCSEILRIEGENTQEYRLLDTAIALPIEERIDAATENLEMEWRQLYDTARRLNDKIKNTFKIDNFFCIDYQNKKMHRAVE